MEYGLRHSIVCVILFWEMSLNPCCNGIWPQTAFFDGPFTCSVLILVVMEYGLRRISEINLEEGYVLILVVVNMVSELLWPHRTQKPAPVLILVVVEYGLGVYFWSFLLWCFCLNPCCRGIWSRRTGTSESRKAFRSLNPCCGGIWSRSLRNTLYMKVLSS